MLKRKFQKKMLSFFLASSMMMTSLGTGAAPVLAAEIPEEQVQETVVGKDAEAMPEIPEEQAQADTAVTQDVPQYSLGYKAPEWMGPAVAIDDDLTVSQLESLADGTVDGIPDVGDGIGPVPEGKVEPAFPAAYSDTEGINKYLAEHLPPTRDQNPYGSCWAHSSMALAESYLIQNGLADTDIDLSERHLVYNTYAEGSNPLFAGTGDKVTYEGKPASDSDVEVCFEQAGGNLADAAATLARWRGATAEDNAKYSEIVSSSPKWEDIEFNHDGAQLKDAFIIDLKNNPKLVKHFIKNYGAVGASIHAVETKYETIDKYFNSEKNAYFYNNSVTKTNHAVTLVGWDDDYPKDNFNSSANGRGGNSHNPPEENGAWLVRNSWTAGKASLGSYYSYFWISYEDNGLNFGTPEVYAFRMQKAASDYNYFYDTLTHGNSYFTVHGAPIESANIFQACGNTEGDEKLESVTVQLFTLDELDDRKYTLDIYTDLTDYSKPDSGKKAATVTGVFPAKGLYTIELDEPVELKKGSLFSAVVTMNGRSVDFEGNCSYLFTENFSGSFQPGSLAGQSFHKIQSGSYWQDQSEGYRGNFCILAHTSKAGETPVTGLVINTDKYQKLCTAPGFNTVQVEYSLIPANATNRKIKWESSAPSVATISDTGVITALKPGNVTFTATALGGTDVEVNWTAEVSRFLSARIYPSGTLKIVKDEPYKLEFQTFPAQVTLSENDIEWIKNTEPSVASVGKDGTLTPLKAGSTTIKASIGGMEAENELTVNVVESREDLISVNSITVRLSKDTIEAGDYIQAMAEVSPAGADNPQVTWESSDPSIAYIDGKGLITGLKLGTVRISAHNDYWDISSEPVSLTVKEKAPESPVPLCEVSFVVSGNLIASKYVETGSPVAFPADPEGDFLGWYKDGVRWAESQPVLEDMTLTAGFLTYSTPSGNEAGMDTDLQVVSGCTLYLIKGQKYTLDQAYTWESDSPKEVKITKKFYAQAKKDTTDAVKLTGTPIEESASGNVILSCNAIVVTVSLPKKTTSLLLGETKELAIAGITSENRANYHILWHSDNPAVATVQDGMVYGAGKGSTVIRAYVNGKALSAKVKVSEVKALKKLTVENGQTYSLAPLQTVPLRISGFKLKGAQWSVSGDTSLSLCEITNKRDAVIAYQNPVVRISTTNGRLYAIGKGEVMLNGQDKDGETISFTVKVDQPQDRFLYVAKNKSKVISIYNVKAGKADWASGNEEIAKILTKGRVKGISAGYTTVSGNYDPYHINTVSGSGFDYNLHAFVEDPSWETASKNAQLTPNRSGTKYKLELKAGEQCILKGKGIYEQVLFKSSNNLVAYMSDAGVVYARNPGKAKLNAKIAGRAYQIIVEVSAP